MEAVSAQILLRVLPAQTFLKGAASETNHQVARKDCSLVRVYAVMKLAPNVPKARSITRLLAYPTLLPLVPLESSTERSVRPGLCALLVINSNREFVYMRTVLPVHLAHFSRPTKSAVRCPAVMTVTNMMASLASRALRRKATAQLVPLTKTDAVG